MRRIRIQTKQPTVTADCQTPCFFVVALTTTIASEFTVNQLKFQFWREKLTVAISVKENEGIRHT